MVSETKPAESQNPKPDETKDLEGWFRLAIFSLWISLLISFFVNGNIETVPYSTFLANVDQGKVQEITMSKTQIEGKLREAKAKTFRTYRIDDPTLVGRLQARNVKFQSLPDDSTWKTIIAWLIPIGIFLFVMNLVAARVQKEGLGPGFLSIEKNRARVYMEKDVKVTFKDVAGVDEAKEELREVIGFLKEPERYNRLGGHLPKGILLVGPPGTGKTLLARAVAGEAAVPFFSISGSEFVELFVGVGAARVRDLFAQASAHAPCIIFIDELDALGRARGLGQMGGHDEKEQTLNQLLVELDGFDTRHGVVLLAATNRPEILDAALLRAGRFDRHILVDRPDKPARVQILAVHMRGVVADETVRLDEIAAATPGFTGADLANLVNEAVLLATRRGADAVQFQDFTAALERVVAGLEKKNRLLNEKERRVVAYHEMGHALVSMSIPGSDPVQKVSIIPRGIGALGYTLQRPTEDRFLMSKKELENKLAVLMGGRAAEKLVFGEISTGSCDDVSKATDIARSIVMRFGMVDSLGPVAYESDMSPFLPGQAEMRQRQFSEETAREVDCAIRDLLNNALGKATSILTAIHTKLDDAANLLLSKETIVYDELVKIVDGVSAEALPQVVSNVMHHDRAENVVISQGETKEVLMNLEVKR